jgi:LCP family protein required for cell wall assembly
LEINDYNIKKAKAGNKHSKVIKILLAVMGVLIAGVAVCAVFIIDMIKDDDSSSLFIDPRGQAVADASTDIIVDQTDDSAPTVQGAIEYNGKTYVKNENVVNLLFLGIDTNTERKVNRKGYRSDVVIVCAVDVEKKSATLISIPRDTYTTVYKVDHDDGTVTEVLQDKINAAYSYGGGRNCYSYENACTAVEMFLQRECELTQPLDFALDIPVYMYAGIDMDGIPQITSAVDGVEVTLEDSVPGVGRAGQTVTLKYQNADEYLRNRHDTGGDLARAERQRTFLLALAKKIKSMGAVDIILNLYDELSRYVDTNLVTDQMLDFAKVLMNVDIDSIESCAIAGTGKTMSGTYYHIPDEQATLELLLDIYYNEA